MRGTGASPPVPRIFMGLAGYAPQSLRKHAS